MYSISRATPNHFEQIYRARYRAYIEQDGYAVSSSTDGRVHDRFDEVAATTHIVAQSAGNIVGGLRLTMWSEHGFPAFDFFDFSPYMPTAYETVANGSMIFVDSSFRRSKVGQTLMMHLFAALLAEPQITHAIGVINPPLASWFQQSGFSILGGHEILHHDGLPFVPVMLAVENLAPKISQQARTLVEPAEY